MMGKYDALFEDDVATVDKTNKYSALFDEDVPPPEEKKQSATGRNLFSLPDNVERAIFPTSGTQATGERTEGFGGSVKQGAMAGLDALSLPTRTLGTLRGYDISDPQSALLRPEIEKVKGAIDKLPAPKEGMRLPQMGNPMGSNIPAADYRIPLKAATEFTGTTISDPLLLTGLLRKIIAKPLQGVATKIESSVLGKGNKALLKEKGLTSDEAAKMALDENIGGNLKGTIKKVNKRSDKLEQGIEDAISDAKSKNPNLTIDVDEPVLRTGERIEKGDPLLYGNTPQGEKAWSDWVDEMDRFKQLSNQTPEEAQKIKRLLSVKGFKKGNIGTPDLGAKETVTDILNLELRDDIAKAVPEIKKFNDQYKKILPIKKLAQNRLPVDQSNNILGLGTLLLSAGKLTPEQYGKIIAYELSRSGDVAQGLYNIGRNIKNANYLVPLSLESNALNAARRKYDVDNDTNERNNR